MVRSQPVDRAVPSVPDHTLLHTIGRGAYGEVWLARNAVGTLRAVKVVYRADFSEAHPFEREFKGIQKFEPVSRAHAGLVDILQIGCNDAEGYFYYVMELADAVELRAADSNQSSVISSQSEVSKSPLPPPTNDVPVTDYSPRTLRSELRARGRLPVEECVRIGQALAGALAHLHAAGLVHRDIKPSNIIFAGGVPKLADIGLVAGVDEARSFVGTEGFIPPEGPGRAQADVFSLGKVLYEMSMGRSRLDFPALPADWDALPGSEQEQLAEFNAVLMKACEVDRARRYRSAEDLRHDLERLQHGRSIRRQRRWEKASRWVKQSVAVAMMLSAAAWLWFRSKDSASPQAKGSAAASIFVLPFRNDGTNQVDELLRSRMTDAVIEGLALIDGVNIRPRKSSWSRLNAANLMHRAATELGARFVVTGKVGQSSNRFGLTLQLLQTPHGRVVAQDTVSGETNRLAALELAALERMAKHLGLAFDLDRQHQIEKKFADNLTALNLQRQGIQFLYLATREGNAAAIEILNRAIDLDPRFVEAHLALAATYREMAYGERQPKEMWSEVSKHCKLALQIDGTLSKPRYHLAWSSFVQNYEWRSMMAEFQTLKEHGELSANEYACHLRILGRFKEARREQDQAELQDPRNLYVRNGVATQAFVDRDYARAIQKAEETVAMYPQFPGGYDALAQCYIETRVYDKALAALEAEGRIVETAWRRALLGYTYARMGRNAEAMAALEELKLSAKKGYVSPYCLALVHAGLGQDEAAIDELQRAYEYRCEELVNADAVGGLRTDPRLDSLRGHPRFQALLKKVGLDVWRR